MHLHCWFVVLAGNPDEAKSEAETFIEEQHEKQFFDYGMLDGPEEAVPLGEIREMLKEEAEKDTAERLFEIEKSIEKWKAMGSRQMLGYSYKRYGEILSEGFCPDMPFFNITDWSWELPDKVPERKEYKGHIWYAVRVDLHY